MKKYINKQHHQDEGGNIKLFQKKIKLWRPYSAGCFTPRGITYPITHLSAFTVEHLPSWLFGKRKEV